MGECSTGNFFIKTGCILSYSGNVQDMKINYTVLLLNVTHAASVLQFTPNLQRRRQRSILAAKALALLAAFQICLCLILGCAGVSIIWCALAGWIVTERRQLLLVTVDLHSLRHASLLVMERVVLMLDVCTIIYYLVKAEAITTLAHICAIALGTLLATSIQRTIPVSNSNVDGCERCRDQLLTS